ncbi:MAG TPA: C40 family peptidase [Gemmatimonadaceae bacterium]|nr:C40 family peptidase [Gemmatimonadaceae bacterium]
MTQASVALAIALAVAPVTLAAQGPEPEGGREAGALVADEMVAVRGPVAGDDIVRAARRQLGVRYVLGGTTPKAFDCSGLVRYVFAQYGLRLPRTAKEQAALGIAPFPGDLQSGDLLFFSGGKGAQHIAIYVGGDTIIHASSSARRVRLDVLSRRRGRPSWFSQRLVAVRRILPLEGTFYVPMATASTAPDSAMPPDEATVAVRPHPVVTVPALGVFGNAMAGVGVPR